MYVYSYIKFHEKSYAYYLFEKNITESKRRQVYNLLQTVKTDEIWGCPGVPVHEGIPFVFITIHGVMTQFVNVSFLCVPVHEDTTRDFDSARNLQSCYNLALV